MRIVNVKDCGEQEIERLLKKAAFDEVELSPAIREGNKKLFGEDLTAAEVVDKIVGDVRREGDAAVIRYTKLIDRTELSSETMLVSDAEFKEAETLVDEKVMDSLRTDPPAEIGGDKVIGRTDYKNDDPGLIKSNVLEFRMESGAKVIARPSGTEPKLKLYLSVKGKDEADSLKKMADLREAANALLISRM